MVMLELLQEIWRPAVEITILTVILYYSILFFRGTRAASVVIGFLMIMLALTVLAVVLDLRVLRWFLGTSFFFSLLAGVVIFQPELRRMLAEIGNLPFLVSVKEKRESVEVVVQAVERLAEKRIGALIALERAEDLLEVVMEAGLTLDCEASPEILETIFYPNNPIHDGGVILSGDRIMQAASIFPLTERQDLGKSLGTRHRAAIGLSEVSDAVIVVVSEETRSISYAFRGELVRGLLPEELRGFLTAVFVKGQPVLNAPPEPIKAPLPVVVPPVVVKEGEG